MGAKEDRVRPDVMPSGLLLAGVVLALAACGGGGKSSSDLPLGTKAVVTHTQIASGDEKAATTTLGITVLRVRKGTQQELTKGGFTVDAKNKSDTPYYVDVRYENTGSAAIKRSSASSRTTRRRRLSSSTGKSSSRWSLRTRRRS